MSDRCLKGCSRELAPIVHNLFQQSLDMHTYCVVLMGIILYCSHSKMPLSSQNNEYRLNSLVMKCLDRLLLGRVSMETSRFQDSHQHAYRRIKSTEDAILVHHDGKKHLDTPKTSVHVLFLDFSSAFNTIQPHTLPQKLRAVLVNPSLPSGFGTFLQTEKCGIRSTTPFLLTSQKGMCQFTSTILSIHK